MEDLSVQSRESEARQIIHNSLRRLEVLLAKQRAGLYRDALADCGLCGDANVSQANFDRIMAYVRRRVPGITLELFSSLTITDLGLVGYAAISADNLGDALRILNNYHELTSDRFRPAMQVTESTTHVIPVAAPGFDANELRDIAEDHLAGTWNILCRLLDAKANPADIRVRLSHPSPSHSQLYEKVFGRSAEFNADKTELLFPTSWLTEPLNISSPGTRDLYKGICARILGPRSRETDTRSAVRTLLLSRQGRAMPGVDEAARTLNLSTDQFRKRLWRQGTSYRALVLEARMLLAGNYLSATGITIQEIAYLLDYSHPAAFTRAFKSYFGVAPVDYRNEI